MSFGIGLQASQSHDPGRISRAASAASDISTGGSPSANKRTPTTPPRFWLYYKKVKDEIEPEVECVNFHPFETSDAQFFAVFFKNLKLLMQCYADDPQSLVHPQRSLFQYLWRHRALMKSDRQMYESQVVLAFNLDSTDGIRYLRQKVLRNEKDMDKAVGQWLANTGSAIDPSMLGNYFSRTDSLEAFKWYVHGLDFANMGIVRFLTFKFEICSYRKNVTVD